MCFMKKSYSHGRLIKAQFFRTVFGNLSAVLVVILTAFTQALAEPLCFWVEFTDKGRYEALTGEDLWNAAFEHGLTEAAIERRRVEGIADEHLVTLDDLPVDSEYLERVSSLGAQVITTSRWFNLAAIEAELRVAERVSELEFVRDIKPMGYLVPTHSEYEVAGEFDGNPPPGPGMDGAGLYGPSYLQALQVNAVEAHRQGFTGQGVLMAVIDGGFTLDHEAYERIDVVATYDVTDNEVAVQQQDKDSPGQSAHGTLCLSTIAGYRPGNLIGTAYEASFLLVKSEYVPTETIQEEYDYVVGLEWAERNGARGTSGSLGYTDWYNDAMKDGEQPITSRALRKARELGVVCVTSAGNEGPQPRTLGPPADHWGGLTIGAVDSLGQIVGFSSRGPTSDGRTKPDLVGRGYNCVAVKPLSHHSYILANGTSLSTPVVAGVVALVRGAHPDWSAERVIRALKSTADRSDRPDNSYGWGVPDAMAAIRYPELRWTFLDENGRAVSRICVTAIHDMADTLRASSDKHGIVSLPNLTPGNWTWHVDLPENWKLRTGQRQGAMTVNDGKSFRIILTEASEAGQP
jgi:subtilisin family serine protease